MITVNEALDHLFSLVSPGPTEHVGLAHAAGRVLAGAVAATHDQPPFAASAMDGYAVRSDTVKPGAVFNVIGESAAGHRFGGKAEIGQAVRIFTGAPMPEGTDQVVIQEDVIRDGDLITLSNNLGHGMNVRPAAADFRSGDTLKGPRILSASDIALLAAMNVAQVPVARRPRVAVMATGDELVMPGETPGPDQIIASNCFGLMALLENWGASPQMLPIARDNIASLETAFDLASGADLIITIGGASVGDHDLVGRVAEDLGMERAFYKIAMRPGKPLMAGRMGGAAMIGLPGNPVSAMVCGHVFLRPVIRAMLGLGATPTPRHTAHLSANVPSNGPREHYMRATVNADGIETATRQDSALLSVLADANALLVRPAADGARSSGELVEYIPI